MIIKYLFVQGTCWNSSETMCFTKLQTKVIRGWIWRTLYNASTNWTSVFRRKLPSYPEMNKACWSSLMLNWSIVLISRLGSYLVLRLSIILTYRGLVSMTNCKFHVCVTKFVRKLRIGGVGGLCIGRLYVLKYLLIFKPPWKEQSKAHFKAEISGNLVISICKPFLIYFISENFN